MQESYAHPEVLVSTEWVAGRLQDPTISVVEISAYPPGSYYQGHLRGAIGWNLYSDLAHDTRRDLPGVAQIEKLLGSSGIDNDTTVVVYSSENQYATWAFWILKYFRHKDVRVMNGGRQKWIAERRELTIDISNPIIKTYRAGLPDKTLRASQSYILRNLGNQSFRLVDNRTHEEYLGGSFATSGNAQPQTNRKGRIPGAIHMPWDAVNSPDGTFMPIGELRRTFEQKEIGPDHDLVSYCHMGVRSSYSWFALKYLLGSDRARNYDGSWVEWGNSIGLPIEVGGAPSPPQSEQPTPADL